MKSIDVVAYLSLCSVMPSPEFCHVKRAAKSTQTSTVVVIICRFYWQCTNKLYCRKTVGNLLLWQVSLYSAQEIYQHTTHPFLQWQSWDLLLQHVVIVKSCYVMWQINPWCWTLDSRDKRIGVDNWYIKYLRNALCSQSRFNSFYSV